ncbi:MAG: ABC transporter ATP-binding protein [Deltaproteobacteria bacterium]|nr:ABC transporter ATP-binding protein [Deltaproteobacteria bacterium]
MRGVSKRYAARPGEGDGEPQDLLRAVDLEVKRGEFVAVEGQSGSGKSTLLHLIGGLDRVYEGEITVLGHALRTAQEADLAALRNRSLGFVFQSFNLLPQLSALDNVLLPEAFGDVPDATRRAQEALARVGLAKKMHARPGHLSGGERQRVAIARALLTRPPLLLADEPTGNLDAATGAGVIELFRELHQSGMTLLVVTHEVRVSRAASRVLLLREGRLDAPQIDPLQTPGEGVK